MTKKPRRKRSRSKPPTNDEDENEECYRCGVKIPEGEQTALWSREGSTVFVTFVCKACAEKTEAEGAADITQELKEMKPATNGE
jgi:hypothetical protein